MNDRFAPLEQVIADRLVAGDAGSSYVAKLADAGLPKVAQKVGEEAVETVIAALNESDSALVGEAADLLFHLTLPLRLRGLGLNEVAAELERRHGISGIIEKAARGGGPETE
ncbi:MAG: phosphoribosyl-ATP diphosphatase [Sphingopyxis sp.]|nr:phosphoribosyl-ATP diphosphatase [Sphingopyxis sp.]